MSAVVWVLIEVIACAVGLVIGVYWPRLFPKFPSGSRVRAYLADPERKDPLTCRYLYHASVGYHRVEVLRGDRYGWGGRHITVKTRDLEAAS